MTATDLEKVMNSLLERRRYNIIIDLGGVDYISSAGWGIFISNIREIRQHSGDIKLARMIPNVYEIFELLNSTASSKPSTASKKPNPISTACVKLQSMRRSLSRPHLLPAPARVRQPHRSRLRILRLPLPLRRPLRPKKGSGRRRLRKMPPTPMTLSST